MTLNRCINMKPLQIESARTLADAGAINHVRVVASSEGLYVEVNKTFTVANRTKQTRYFAKADTCFSWLREMGISRIHEVDLSHWGVDEEPTIPGLSGVLAFWNFSVSAVIGSEWMRHFKKVESLHNKGRHAEALIVANQALQLAEEALEPDHPDIAVLLNGLAIEHYALKQFDQAEPLYRRAMTIAEKRFDPNDPFVATCLNNLAESCDALGRSDETESLYLRALEMCEKDSESDQSMVAVILTNLASLYAKQSSAEQAVQLGERALEIWVDLPGLRLHKPLGQAVTLDLLAALYRQSNRDGEALSLEKQAADIRSKWK